MRMKKKIRDNLEPDICVMCGKETNYARNIPVSDRVGYLEGSGQLCFECFERIYVKRQDSSDNCISED